jgi:hypothetical protein
MYVTFKKMTLVNNNSLQSIQHFGVMYPILHEIIYVTSVQIT